MVDVGNNPSRRTLGDYAMQ